MLEYLIPQASSFAHDIDWLFLVILVTVGFWFFVAQGVLFYFIFRFRRKDGVRSLYVAGEEKIEKPWVRIPHVLVIICDIGLIAGTILVWITVKQALPAAEEKVRIIGQQWAWTFIHAGPDGQHDKKIVDTEPLRYPRDTILYQNTGFQGYAPKVQQLHQAKKNRAPASYPVGKSATIENSHGSGSAWNMPWPE